jgi:hypothetical protein
MSNETVKGIAVSACYMPPEGDEIRVKVRIRRRARRGSKMEYGDNWIELEISMPPYIGRDLVQSIRNSMTKVKEDKASALRSADSWLEEIRRAATA